MAAGGSAGAGRHAPWGALEARPASALPNPRPKTLRGQGLPPWQPRLPPPLGRRLGPLILIWTLSYLLCGPGKPLPLCVPQFPYLAGWWLGLLLSLTYFAAMRRPAFVRPGPPRPCGEEDLRLRYQPRWSVGLGSATAWGWGLLGGGAFRPP